MNRISFPIALFVASLFFSSGSSYAAEHEWTGRYLGVHIDLQRGQSHVDRSGSPYEHDVSGGGAGIEFIHRWRAENTVYGLNADLTIANTSGDFTTTACALPGGNCTKFTTEVEAFETLRAHIGCLVGDEYLIYVTGGLAGGNVRLQPRAVSQPREDAKFRTGWVVGIGVTAPINDRWTWGIEYLYADFGTENRPNDSTSDLQQQLRFSTGRLSVNYKF